MKVHKFIQDDQWKKPEPWLVGKHGDDVGQTMVRTHQHATSVPKKRGRKRLAARATGGPKIHAVVDALGKPQRWLLNGGEVVDINQAQPLLPG